MYKTTIIAIKTRTKKEGCTKPNSLPSEVKGKTSVVATITIVARIKYFLGKLLKKGLRLRITSTIKLAERTDSTNHPVLNRSMGLCQNKKISTPKAM
jgi:hypothetical protein